MFEAAALIPAAAANKHPHGVSALLRGGHPWPKPLWTSGGRALGVRQGWLLPGRPDVVGGRPLASQTPESQFPVAANTRREKGTWVEAGEGREPGGRSGWGAEIPVVAAVGWDRQKTICQIQRGS